LNDACVFAWVKGEAKSLHRLFTCVGSSWLGRVQIELRDTEGGEHVEDGGQGSDHGIFTYRRKYLPTRQVRANLASDPSLTRSLGELYWRQYVVLSGLGI
jgi:hypothetical protein